MVVRVENINSDILRKCREQVRLSLEYVKKRVGTISDIEEGKKYPTFRQLDILAKLYGVPRWVFISESLPQQYQLKEAIPAFREFANTDSELFDNHKIRLLVAAVEQLREFILDLRGEIGEPVDLFDPPRINDGISPEDAATTTRTWLEVEENHDLTEWREKLEEKNIFIFMASKYQGWSHIGKSNFRGLSLYHPTLPIIVINDADAKKAQSFTLFHELGHLLRQENMIDSWNENNQQTEIWCNQFAGNVLMPTAPFRNAANDINNLESVKCVSNEFKVSPYAGLVRLRELRIIDQSTYSSFENDLRLEYENLQKKLKSSDGGPSRNRAKEVLNQYGRIYTNVVVQSYHNQEIGLHKLCKLFDLRRVSHALDLKALL